MEKSQKPRRARIDMIPVIGAVAQILSPRYRIERRDPRTHQIKSAYVVLRDRYEVGDRIKWGYGAYWTIAEVLG